MRCEQQVFKKPTGRLPVWSKPVSLGAVPQSQSVYRDPTPSVMATCWHPSSSLQCCVLQALHNIEFVMSLDYVVFMWAANSPHRGVKVKYSSHNWHVGVFVWDVWGMWVKQWPCHYSPYRQEVSSSLSDDLIQTEKTQDPYVEGAFVHVCKIHRMCMCRTKNLSPSLEVSIRVKHKQQKRHLCLEDDLFFK